MSRRLLCLLLCLGLLAACAPAELELVTAVMLPTVPPEVAATATAAAYATSLAPPTLPPTWTPSPMPTPTVAELAPTEVPAALAQLFFVADGAIWQVGVGSSDLRQLTTTTNAHDLVPSPDGRMLAFVATGSLGVDELYVIPLADGIARQVTTLGYAELVDPAWHPASDMLAFAAGPVEGGPREVYTVRPDGQDLDQVTDLARLGPLATPVEGSPPEASWMVTAVGLSSPLFTPDGSGILFAAPALHLVNRVSGDLTTLTAYTEVGNDAAPQFRPGTTEVAYIRPAEDVVVSPAGFVHVFDLNTQAGEQIPPTVVNMAVHDFAFSADGKWMTFAHEYNIGLVDYRQQAARLLTDSGEVLPFVALNADGSQIYYIGDNITEGANPQVLVVGRSGRDPDVVVDIIGEDARELVWIAGE